MACCLLATPLFHHQPPDTRIHHWFLTIMKAWRVHFENLTAVGGPHDAAACPVDCFSACVVEFHHSPLVVEHAMELSKLPLVSLRSFWFRLFASWTHHGCELSGAEAKAHFFELVHEELERRLSVLVRIGFRCLDGGFEILGANDTVPLDT
jgi:hypothetical protein